ncbi:MAG: VOC family protein [Proteobacteria bacterium]|nr:VOC family protein [Pseudomonadota bacterium]
MNFDHAVLAASDLDASLPWYEAVMAAIGFAKSRDHVWVNDAGQALELRQAVEADYGYRRHGVGMNHIAFTAPSLAAIEAVADQVRAAGFEVADIQSFGRDRALFLKDPDGMRIELTAYDAA